MDAVDRQEVGSGPRVSQWYSGRSVLVTGATGLLGRVLVEKLLRSCPDIATVYLLMRPKRGLDPEERFEAFTTHVLFSKLREERPDFARQLSTVAGDISSSDFQIAEQDMVALRRDVSAVFHCAASVRFDDTLRQAVTTNVVGTKNMLQLAEKLPNLKVFVHISTSFCHSDHQVLEEKLYPPEGDPEKIMNIVFWMDDELLKIVTPKLLGNLPNTYALTKNLAEELVARYADRLPIVIARPSIVVSCWKEPLIGWTANMNGPTGFMIAGAKGILRVVMVDTDIASDCVPVDCTANAIIIVAWHVAITNQASPYVCNITNGDLKRVTWGETIKICTTVAETEVPLMPILWYCDPVVTTSVVIYTICHFFFEVFPAHILDFFIFLSGRKPFLVHINNRLQSAKTMMRYYMLHEWKFINRNILSLHKSLSTEDQETFYFNLADIDVNQYFKNSIIGSKVYLLNESMDDIPKDLRNLRRMYWLHNTVRVTFYGLLLWLLYTWSQPALQTIESVMEYLTSLFHGAPIIRTLEEKILVSSNGMPQDVADVKNS